MTAPPISRLKMISLVTAELQAAMQFYQRAFGCRAGEVRRREGADFEHSMDVDGGALGVILELGRQRIELLQFDRPGRTYPTDERASDLSFQHFAVVVSDMDRALDQLHATPGWAAISTAGAQRLPPSSGGVTAFKFRDPEGHPLELLRFPNPPDPWRGTAAVCLGIDHSAISVADCAASMAYYESLGLAVNARSHNVGDEQARLDGLPHADVQVVALTPAAAPPHLELLCYRSAASPRAAATLQANDIAATRLLFETKAAQRAPLSLRDPDGHRLLIVAGDAADEPPLRRAAGPRST